MPKPAKATLKGNRWESTATATLAKGCAGNAVVLIGSKKASQVVVAKYFEQSEVISMHVPGLTAVEQNRPDQGKKILWLGSNVPKMSTGQKWLYFKWRNGLYKRCEEMVSRMLTGLDEGKGCQLQSQKVFEIHTCLSGGD